MSGDLAALRWLLVVSWRCWLQLWFYEQTWISWMWERQRRRQAVKTDKYECRAGQWSFRIALHPKPVHLLSFCSLLLLHCILFLIYFTYFLLLSIPFLSTRIVPLGFQAWGRRRRPNLGLVCFVHYCVICIA